MKNKLTVSKDAAKEIILCSTTSPIVSERAAHLLMESGIAYSKRYKRIPYIVRNRFRGHDQMCYIMINRMEYGRARRCIEALESRDSRRLHMNLV